MSHPLPDTLTRTLSSHLELGKTRLQTLAWMMIGIVNARTVNMSHMAWAYACATALKGTKAIKKAKHGYRIKSWFRTGLDQLRRWLLHQPLTAAEIWERMWPKRMTALKFGRVV